MNVAEVWKHRRHGGSGRSDDKTYGRGTMWGVGLDGPRAKQEETVCHLFWT